MASSNESCDWLNVSCDSLMTSRDLPGVSCDLFETCDWSNTSSSGILVSHSEKLKVLQLGGSSDSAPLSCDLALAELIWSHDLSCDLMSKSSDTLVAPLSKSASDNLKEKWPDEYMFF